MSWAASMACEPIIRFGVAGWSYPDWNGTVYPRGVGDRLAYLAEYVDFIEINSTFYRIPSSAQAGRWVRTVELKPAFAFSAKLHQDVTHRGLLEAGSTRLFHEGLAPLAEAGRLRHLLAQFRFDFDDLPAHRERLARVSAEFGGLAPVTFELRHRSWQSEGALAFLRELGVNVAALDYPAGRNAFDIDDPGVGQDAYLRLHGRNAAAWFDKHAGRDETYNYYYSRAEREALRDRAARLAHGRRSLTVVGNNHYEGKELANILQLKALMTGGRVAVPPPLMAAYPELSEVAAADGMLPLG